ncbi:MAG: ABC transporter substrate-binding protein [Pseudomonadota bacterium]
MVKRARLLLLGLAVALGSQAWADEARPRVVSLDYCADQYVLALADRDQIAAISSGPDDAWSHFRSRAEGLPLVRAAAEDVIALQPDLILRSYGGGPRALGFYERLGLEVHQIGYEPGLDAARARVREIGAALGQAARADVLIARMDATLLEAGAEASNLGALYVTPGGVTAGAGVIVDDMLTAAGVRNLAAERGETGWPSLSLEALMLERPELVVTGFFNMPREQLDPWSASRHPLMRRRLDELTTIQLDGALLSCSAWFIAEAALKVSEAARDLSGAP